MFDLPTLNQGAIDSSSILSLNRTTSGALTNQNIGGLNRATLVMAGLQAAQNMQGMQSGFQNAQPMQSGFQNAQPMQSGFIPEQPASSAPVYSSQPMQTQMPQAQQPYGSPAPIQGQTPVAPAPTPVAPTTTPVAAPVSAPITKKPMPVLQKKVQKGQKVPLFSGAPSQGIKVCLGWNVKNAQCELDVSAFLLGANGKVLGDDWFVFYGQEQSPDNSTVFQMANDPNDRELIQTTFSALNPSVTKIVYVLTINEAMTNHLNFSMVEDAYIRILDSATNEELVSYCLADYYPNVISMMLGEVYIHNGSWKFNAVGNGVAKDLAGLCELYGVQVI